MLMLCVSSGDCGAGVQCGEYLFDLRNTSLQAWMAGDYLLSSTGLGNSAIDGFYFDDDWSSNGPSEEDRNAVNATGLSKADVADMVTAWNVTSTSMYASVIANGGFVWQTFYGGGAPQSAPGRSQTDPQADCASWIRGNCGPDAPFLSSSAALFFGFTRVQHSKPFPLPAFEQDLATFLLVRGPYAWLGCARCPVLTCARLTQVHPVLSLLLLCAGTVGLVATGTTRSQMR